MSEQIVFRCKYCGADIIVDSETKGIVQCAYCTEYNTLPKKETEPEAVGYIRMGAAELYSCDFDKAYDAYYKASQIDEHEPEAYFGMALAAYKVQYIKDEVAGRYQPICHEVNDSVFTQDRNYRKAFTLATNEQKEQYEKQGKEIDYIRQEFYKLKESGLDYDCFICVKVTDDERTTVDGKKVFTADYKTADDLYFYLRGKGYKPFFSEREIGNRTGVDYEVMILYALHMSECMLVVCSNESYLQTPWVKNEYVRFLKMIADEEKESDSVAIVFNGKPIEKLSTRKGKLQGIDSSKGDAYEKIIAFVDKHTPESKNKREEDKKRKTTEEEARKRKLDEQYRAIQEQQKQIEQQAKEREEREKAFAQQLEELKKQTTTPKSNSKYCLHCGAENPQNVKFCGECGKNGFAATLKEYAEIIRKRAQEEIVAAETAKRERERLTAEATEKAESERIEQEKASYKYKREGDFILFGEWPQSIKEDNVTVSGQQDSNGYYKGSDGYKYSKVTAQPCGNNCTFSTGAAITKGTAYYFKVEPIKWRILEEKSGNALVLCESIIANRQYSRDYNIRMIDGKTVYPNNYMHSGIRAWLNKTFYETAFGKNAQELIVAATVDNSAATTADANNQYACANTKDKVFLLSYKDIANRAYGFDASDSVYDTARRKQVSDYARATGASMYTESDYFGNGWWWLRSPEGSSFYSAHYVSDAGYAYYHCNVFIGSGGVLPALRIRL